MKTSHFGFVKEADAIAAAGYDAIELHIKEIMSFDDFEFRRAKQMLRDSGLASEVFDNPLPLDVVIADDSFDFPFYRDYLRKAVERTAQMGGRYFVYGNGKTRSLPDGVEKDTARKKNDQLIVTLCEIAQEYNITIMMEPLAGAICNSVLSIPEAYEYAKKLGCKNLKTLLDFRWFIAGGHDYSDIVEYADFIKHVHVDNPLLPFPERRVPMLGDGFDYGTLFETLKEISYKGYISYEANTFDDFETDIRKGLSLLEHYNIYSYGAKEEKQMGA
ncbi:Sugar phosphate isomerase/epimerase [Hespellia stercorisuis DSM 15480]|uniref:Sugar phosphate isomerase/epimerase n=2 Tax=Hespellia stercorisuis TaxID=180311 RepID=A0A1M6M710_9FIRM|nr:Sugar phosphate isomerase/epimerase [Hespellia stercorisuis DSM 15480]